MTTLRSSLIRLASNRPDLRPRLLPILAGREVMAAGAFPELSPPVDAGGVKGARGWMSLLRMAILDGSEPESPKRAAMIKEAKEYLGYAMFLFRNNKSVVKLYQDERAALDHYMSMTTD